MNIVPLISSVDLNLEDTKQKQMDLRQSAIEVNEGFYCFQE